MDTFNKNAIIIQRCYRHHLQGKINRQKLKLKYMYELWGFKPFRIALIWDESDCYIRRSKSYRDFLDWIVRCIDTLFHPDSDDDEDYLLTDYQKHLILKTKNKPNLYRKDMNIVLKSLSIIQLMLIR